MSKIFEANWDEDKLIILSGDERQIAIDTLIIASRFKIPCLNVGYLNDYSVIGPFYIPTISACPYCGELDMEEKIDGIIDPIYNSRYESPASFVNNSFASAMAMMDIYNYHSGEYGNINSLNKRIGIDNSNFEKLELNIERNLNCEICASKI